MRAEGERRERRREMEAEISRLRREMDAEREMIIEQEQRCQTAKNQARAAEQRASAAEREASDLRKQLVSVTEESLYGLNRRRLDDLQDQLSEAQRRVVQYIREQAPVCSICDEREHDVVLGCGHQLCSVCANNKSIKTCPFCRAAIKQKIPLRRS